MLRAKARELLSLIVLFVLLVPAVASSQLSFFGLLPNSVEFGWTHFYLSEPTKINAAWSWRIIFLFSGIIFFILRKDKKSITKYLAVICGILLAFHPFDRFGSSIDHNLSLIHI